MKNFKNSLFWRISASFCIILILLGLGYISITVYFSRKFYQETTQRVNANVAEHMLHEVSPFIGTEVNEEALGTIMHSMMAVNPSLEVYLLNEKGDILSYVVLDKKVRLKNVNVSPIRDFIKSKGQSYVLGDDPRNPGGETIFSATEVVEDGVFKGYVYMVLASEKYENVVGALSSSYFMKLGAQSFIITLFAAFSIGLILIALLTKNLRIIIQTVRNFENGDYSARIPVSKKGELANLSRTFNQMADTIVSNIDQLKEVDKLRRDLIANVSHDLRSPMAVIHGYIETLIIKEDRLLPEERKKYLEIVLQSSEKLQKLVSDLFELSKLEAEQIKIQSQAINLSEFMAEAQESYQLQAAGKNIVLESNIPDETIVSADINLMQRVIQNLMDNALKYTPENGEVKIFAKTNREKIDIEISNSGGGIPEENLPHIFDRYYMVDPSQKQVAGTGLGLAIVKKIIELHKSTIMVKSKKDGFTTFSFSLPLA